MRAISFGSLVLSYKVFKVEQIITNLPHLKKQGRKRPLDTPKRMIERREREVERERKVEGEI